MSNRTFEEKFLLPKRYKGQEPSVWNEYTQLAIEYQPLSLAHGYTDWQVPSYITDTLAAVAQSPDVLHNQYTRGFGHPRLVQALSAVYSKLINRKIDPFTEILVTAGAFESLYSAIHGYIEEGDEVIIIEPSFDSYEPVVKMCGGIVRHIPLRLKKSSSGAISSADYVLDDKELEGLFSDKTKMIVINTPNNPLGKIYNREEMTKIADLCEKFNVIVLTDEVYEWMIFDDNEHVRMSALPGMWERTISVGTAGKSLAVTGWKVGWSYGPKRLLENLRLVHQSCVYTCPTPIQEAIARILETEFSRLDSSDGYFKYLASELQKKRDFMVKLLTSIGMKPIVPQGGYYCVADWSPLENRADMNSESDPQKDYRFTKWMIKNVGLQGIPTSAFFNEKNKSLMEHTVRLCYFKKDETLQKAAEILQNWISK